METKNGSRIESLRKALKAEYQKTNQYQAAHLDRLSARAVVRVYKIVFGKQAFNEIKEAN